VPYADSTKKKSKDQTYYERVTKPKREAARKARLAASANPTPAGPKALIHAKVGEADKAAVKAKLSTEGGDGSLPQTTLNAVVESHFAALAAGKVPRYITPKAKS
jgi:hypothetical protein